MHKVPESQAAFNIFLLAAWVDLVNGTEVEFQESVTSGSQQKRKVKQDWAAEEWAADSQSCFLSLFFCWDRLLDSSTAVFHVKDSRPQAAFTIS